jgi:hypothetical protein
VAVARRACLIIVLGAFVGVVSVWAAEVACHTWTNQSTGEVFISCEVQNVDASDDINSCEWACDAEVSAARAQCIADGGSQHACEHAAVSAERTCNRACIFLLPQ